MRICNWGSDDVHLWLYLYQTRGNRLWHGNVNYNRDDVIRKWSITFINRKQIVRAVVGGWRVYNAQACCKYVDVRYQCVVTICSLCSQEKDLDSVIHRRLQFTFTGSTHISFSKVCEKLSIKHRYRQAQLDQDSLGKWVRVPLLTWLLCCLFAIMTQVCDNRVIFAQTYAIYLMIVATLEEAASHVDHLVGYHGYAFAYVSVWVLGFPLIHQKVKMGKCRGMVSYSAFYSLLLTWSQSGFLFWSPASTGPRTHTHTHTLISHSHTSAQLLPICNQCLLFKPLVHTHLCQCDSVTWSRSPCFWIPACYMIWFCAFVCFPLWLVLVSFPVFTVSFSIFPCCPCCL